MKKTTLHYSHSSLLVLLFLLLSPAIAMAQPPGSAFMQHPPQSAIDACQGKSVGDSVEFVNNRGETVTATCTLRAVADQPQFKRRLTNKGFSKRGKGKGQRGFFAANMAQILKLTAEQQTQLSELRTKHLQSTTARRQQMIEQRLEVKQAQMARPFDEARLRAAIAKNSQARADMLVEKARLRQQLFDILTKEQQQALAQHQLERMLGIPDDMPKFGSRGGQRMMNCMR